MEIIDHGNGIVEYRNAIEDSAQVIANINSLDEDKSIHEVLPAFADWMEGYADSDGVWRPVNVKGRNKVVRWSETRFREDLTATWTRAAELVVDPIWSALKNCVELYANHMQVPVPDIVSKNIDIRSYVVGANLGLHTDVNHDGPFTHHSLVIYLNDDYEGGELWFPGPGVKIKPEAGSILAFPATTPHESLAVTKGEKWHSPCFWYEELSLVTSGKEAPALERF